MHSTVRPTAAYNPSPLSPCGSSSRPTDLPLPSRGIEQLDQKCAGMHGSINSSIDFMDKLTIIPATSQTDAWSDPWMDNRFDVYD